MSVRALLIVTVGTAIAAATWAAAPTAAQIASRPASSTPAKPYVRAAREANGTPIPKTPWGQPDLSGLWDKRPYGGTNMAQGVQPLPFTAEGLKAYNDVWNHVDPTSRCVLPGVPRVNNSPYPMQIIQMQDKVIMLYEYMHNHRLIYTDGRGHPKEYLPQLMGHSIGKWEGDTLVIDSVDFTDASWLGWPGWIHSYDMRVEERITREGDSLRWQATVHDPEMLLRAWTTNPVVRRLNRTPRAELPEDLPCSERDAQQIVTKERG